MKIDKENGNVKYNDASHVYWDDNGKYISVTTLIGKYGQPFNRKFWSAYKALEKIMTPEEFKMEKGQMLATKKIDIPYILETYNIKEVDFNKAQQDILDQWQEKNKQSCARGTKIHAELENLYTSKKETDLKKFGLGGKFKVNTNASLKEENLKILDIDKGVFPEYLVYSNSNDGKLKLAGQIDLLIKDGNDIIIYDYKTNEHLDDTSYFDIRTKKNQMMKYPLNTLMDCNKIHYTLQLSTYAWMLQKLNPDFKIKKLCLIHYDHNDNVTEHEVPYLKKSVEIMLKDYKKKLLLKEKADSRKPIVF